MTVREMLAVFRPETGGRGEKDWEAFATRVWREEGVYMAKFKRWMAIKGGWVKGPVLVNDGVVQDGHHRLLVAVALGWEELQVPWVEV